MPLAILQARMSSTRLPGKVLADVAGAPMILRQIERLKRSAGLRRIVVATSDQASDDPLAAKARAKMHGAREGAAGGDGEPAGGGCGCSN